MDDDESNPLISARSQADSIDDILMAGVSHQYFSEFDMNLSEIDRQTGSILLGKEQL